MYGSQAPVQQPTLTMMGSSSGIRTAQTNAANTPLGAIPVVAIVAIAAYFVWAAVEQHERVQEAVEPHNVALNVRNFFHIGLAALLFFFLLKVALAKLTAWGVPGAKAVALFVGGAT